MTTHGSVDCSVNGSVYGSVDSSVLVQGHTSGGAAARRGVDLKRFKDFDLNTKARIWPLLFCMFYIRSTTIANERHWPGKGTWRDDNPAEKSRSSTACRWRANSARIRQSGPDAGPGSQVKVSKTLQVVASSRGCVVADHIVALGGHVA